ncbi:unnamed protein product [Absidia cylindrospora]
MARDGFDDAIASAHPELQAINDEFDMDFTDVPTDNNHNDNNDDNDDNDNNDDNDDNDDILADEFNNMTERQQGVYRRDEILRLL